MAVTYTDHGTIGTMTCDREGCDAVFHDGLSERDLSHLPIGGRARAAGWKFCRPTPYRQTDICPTCPPDEHY